MTKTIDAYLYAYGNAAKNSGCAEGPLVLKRAIESQNNHYHWHEPLRVSNHKQQRDALHDVTTLCGALAQSTQRSVINHHFFITFGGDHSCAIGSWSGAATAIADKGDLGLIWFDAHMDAHTFETTPSNNIHGMPLASLLGHGDTALTHLLSDKPKLKPDNVALIGVRSYESGEAALLKKLGVKIFYMDDIKKLGMRDVISQALEIVTRNTYRFGISIDLDGFDPLDAPGVGSREENGVNAAEFLEDFSMISKHPRLIGMDIVEFNPSLDRNRQTEKLAVALCKQITTDGKLGSQDDQH